MLEQKRENITPDRLDRLDRQLLHALALCGRAPFRRIATVLGTSEQTVARRYRRLRDAGVMRVLLLPAPRDEDQGLMLRLSTQPSSTRTVANALAARPDVSWIRLMSAGTEIFCGVRSSSRADRDRLLLDQLPRTGRLLGVTAYALLHHFHPPGRADWDGFDDPLDDEQRAALRDDGQPAGQPAVPPPDEMDETLLRELATDGRASYALLAGRTGRTEAAVARRIATLQRARAIVPDIDYAPELLGKHVTATLYLNVDPARLHEIGERVCAHAETSFTAAVTGPANLLASVFCRDIAELYGYVATTLGGLEAVRHIEVSPVVEHVKQARALVHGPRLRERA